MMNSKDRFSNRVGSYVKYRPSYPVESIDYLYETVGFGENVCIADVGSGTGIFSELLLARGSQVIAVEPNAAMRDAAVKRLGDQRAYEAASGSAEETGLLDQSVDHIVCAQSFHWFDRAAARDEFKRIVRPGGKVVLIWNSRKTTGSPFLEQFENLLLTYGTDYDQVGHKFITEATLRTFYKDDSLRLERFSMRQTFDLEGLKGRVQSSSYSPMPEHPNYKPMIEELNRIFDRNERDGIIHMDYETELYWGEI